MKGLRQLGEDPRPVLEKYGLDLETIDPATRIDRALELKIHAEVAERLHDPLAGLKAGRFFSFAGYGPLAMLLLTCADIEGAIRAGIHYQRLTYLYSELGFKRGAALSALTLTPIALPPRAFRFRIDGEVAGTYKLLQDLQMATGASLRPESVDMPYAAPREAATYERHFGCRVRFGETQARFWLRSEHLRLEFPTHDGAAHTLYRGMCDEQLQRQSDARELAHKVRLHLDLFCDQMPDMARVAGYFGLPERSFRRQLQREGTGFRALVNQAHYRRARQLLRHTKLSIEAIARRLGYAEPAAFIHAFRRWSGMTPAAFRAGELNNCDE